MSPGSGLTNDWRNLLAVFSAYLRLQHPILPFITEELWHRFGQNTSIALARYPQAGAIDEAAEREMGLLQDMVTAARKLKADNGLDEKMELAGVLYCRNGASKVELPVLERLGKVKLEVRSGAAPVLTGAVRSTTYFDLSLQLPEVDRDALRQRLTKENEKLQKTVDNTDRQLASEKVPERTLRRTSSKSCGPSAPGTSTRSRKIATRSMAFDPDRRIEWHTTHRFDHDRSAAVWLPRARPPARSSAPTNKPRVKAATVEPGTPNQDPASMFRSSCGINSRPTPCPWSRSRSAWRYRMRSSKPPASRATCAGRTTSSFNPRNAPAS